MLKVSYHAVKGVQLQCFLGHRSSHDYLHVVTVRDEGKGETVVTTPDRLDWFSCLKRLHVLES
jgi:hypothetical protein